MKGLTVSQMGSFAVALVVVALMISIGASIMGEMQDTTCVGTYATFNSTGNDSVGVDPVSSTYTGCCTTVDVDNECRSWFSSASYNSTYSGTQGLSNFGDWLPLIALVIAASIVIGIVVRHMGNAGA